MFRIAGKNRQLVLDYFDLTFNQHNPIEAAQKFLSEDYWHHGSGCGSCREDFVCYFSQFFTEKPNFQAEVLQCVAENDYVALRVAIQSNALEAKIEVAEFYRLMGYKIVEHWHIYPS